MTVAMAESYAVCKACGTKLPINHQGACSECGKDAGANKFVSVEPGQYRVAGLPVTVLTTKEFYEKNAAAHRAVVGIAIASPLVGLVVGGVPGVIVGGVISAVSYFLGPKAITKVREITKH